MMESTMKWDRDAEKALGRAPFFVRGMVRRKVEERVRKNGGARVSLADFQEAEARFRAVMGGKTTDELKSMMPVENRPGAEMVVVEVCHAELSNCPNVLIKPSGWKKAVEKWVADSGVSERLRGRVSGDKILYHNKFRISISGCPNGCSRPQIADIGIVGFTRPGVSHALCTFCGACADVCPDAAIEVAGAPPMFDRLKCQGCLKCRDVCPHGAIELSDPGARLLAGGKLGRHPKLAETVGEFTEKGELIKALAGMVDDFIEHAAPEERLADFLARGKGGAI